MASYILKQDLPSDSCAEVLRWRHDAQIYGQKLKVSNKPCDKGCFVDTRMFLSNAACANHANPWERRRTTLGGGGCLLRIWRGRSLMSHLKWLKLQCTMFQKHKGQSCKDPTAKAARCFNKRRWSKQRASYHSCVGPQRHIRSNPYVCKLVQRVWTRCLGGRALAGAAPFGKRSSHGGCKQGKNEGLEIVQRIVFMLSCFLLFLFASKITTISVGSILKVRILFWLFMLVLVFVAIGVRAASFRIWILLLLWTWNVGFLPNADTRSMPVVIML